ncbi:MAG: hypothetical protein AVDCRST_MAG55-523 [uncultured Rubrobacteraceae bacterium]|uniref:Uncharacterized protein n=1 Tax=uncultured Rubrobacteraceae bacterium TaxID=349277 RepID=A0A6J4P206_9ACTN|nr:MAG: hypothetical protein AVDCRST_MAG55-523 [uncultured Rubrobacteraceae bacterium]
MEAVLRGLALDSHLLVRLNSTRDYHHAAAEKEELIQISTS